jgi:hypothetical protein
MVIHPAVVVAQLLASHYTDLIQTTPPGVEDRSDATDSP